MANNNDPVNVELFNYRMDELDETVHDIAICIKKDHDILIRHDEKIETMSKRLWQVGLADFAAALFAGLLAFFGMRNQ